MKLSLRIKYQNRKTNRESHKIYDVIEEAATLNRKYRIRRFYIKDHNTLFKEVSIVPYRDAIPQDWLIKVEREKQLLSKADFVDGLIETLREYIRETWSKVKYHAVFHSSGWDSRIVATIIRQLYDELGDSWLGELKFVCLGRECKNVKSILEAEGWGDDLAVILPLDNSYFAYNLNFRMAWKYVNGYAPYPINNSLWGFNELKRRHPVPENLNEIQVWAASFFNELIGFTSERETNTIDGFLKKYYYCTYAHFASAFPCNFIQPILNENTIRFLLSFKTDFSGNLRHLMVKRLNSKVADISPYAPTRVRVSMPFLKQTVEDYKNSWYGTNVLQSPKFTDKLSHSDWWSAWSAASFIDHLVKRGTHVS